MKFLIALLSVAVVSASLPAAIQYVVDQLWAEIKNAVDPDHPDREGHVEYALSGTLNRLHSGCHSGSASPVCRVVDELLITPEEGRNDFAWRPIATIQSEKLVEIVKPASGVGSVYATVLRLLRLRLAAASTKLGDWTDLLALPLALSDSPQEEGLKLSEVEWLLTALSQTNESAVQRVGAYFAQVPAAIFGPQGDAVVQLMASWAKPIEERYWQHPQILGQFQLSPQVSPRVAVLGEHAFQSDLVVTHVSTNNVVLVRAVERVKLCAWYMNDGKHWQALKSQWGSISMLPNSLIAVLPATVQKPSEMLSALVDALNHPEGSQSPDARWAIVSACHVGIHMWQLL